MMPERVGHDDGQEDLEWLVKKIAGLRIFDDDAGVMNRSVGTGEFGAYMEVSLVNDGPVTICIDTKNKE